MNRSRIAVVGPLLPYRGGISQYNTLLARAFAEQGEDALFVSYTRQYPQWLYPGDGDVDQAMSDHREPGALYLVDSLNPLTWRKAVQEIQRNDVRLAVLHWWTWFWAPYIISTRWMLKRRGIRVAMICHNLADHDAKGIKAAISRYVLGLGDCYLVHSQEHADELSTAHPDKPIEMHPIPAYGHYPEARGTLPKRGRLELLFFGFIRPYKGLDKLLDAIEVLDDHEVFLTVVGEHWGDSSDLTREYADHPNVSLRFEYVNDVEAAEYFARADYVVLPYVGSTPSAVVALAYNYNVPVIASRVGGLVDVVIDGETGHLVPPGNPAALADALRTASRTDARDLSAGVEKYKSTHGWDAIVGRLRALADS